MSEYEATIRELQRSLERMTEERDYWKQMYWETQGITWGENNGRS